MRKIVLGAALVVLLVGCGGSDDAADDGGTDDTTTTTVTATTTPSDTTKADSTTTTAAPDTGTGAGDYSVIVVSGVDSLTANSNLDDLHAAGFDAFEIDGADDTGYTVFQSGLSQTEAEEVLQQVRDAVFGGSSLPGIIAETEVWFGPG